MWGRVEILESEDKRLVYRRSRRVQAFYLLIILVLIAFSSCNRSQNDSISSKQVQSDFSKKEPFQHDSIAGSFQHDSEEKQALKMLRDFYYTYVGTFVNDTTIIPGKLDSIKKQNCTKGLLKKISEQEANGDLEVDPFLQAQDANSETLKTLSFSKDLNKSNVYIVSYNDNSEGKIDIYLTLVKRNNELKISNVSGRFGKVRN